MTDDFDRLGAAVARVLREAFATAEDLRRDGAADAAELAASVAAEVEQSLRAALALRSQVKAETEGVLASVRSTASTAATAVGSIVEAAKVEAEGLRTAAADETKAVVQRAKDELARARALAEAERVRFDHELGALTGELQAAVDALEKDVVTRRRVLLEKAKAEAAAIVRQARQHHRAVAAEVDRMIEAAAADAAALRASAREDALRITEQAAGVVNLAPRRRGSARSA
jgi:hypothetical protein